MPGLDFSGSPPPLHSNDRYLFKAHKQLPRNRDPKQSALRFGQSISLYDPGQKNTEGDSLANKREVRTEERRTRPVSLQVRSKPSLPPTPPSAPQDIATQNSTDRVVSPGTPLAQHQEDGTTTPTNQRSPPTPDHTPPKKVLSSARLGPTRAFTDATVSSRAESFKTAKEEQSSTEDLTRGYDSSASHPAMQRWLDAALPDHAANVIQTIGLAESDVDDITPTETTSRKQTPIAGQNDKAFTSFDGDWGNGRSDNETTAVATETGSPAKDNSDDTIGNLHVASPKTPQKEHTVTESYLDSGSTGIRSSRRSRRSQRSETQRRSGSRSLSPLAKFGREIGWTPRLEDLGLNDRVRSWRNSGVSSTSTTVEAMVVETASPRNRRLRHVEKTASLRAASSPVPQSSVESFDVSSPRPARRLSHKAGHLSNANRWSLSPNVASSPKSSSPTGLSSDSINIPKRSKTTIKYSTSHGRQYLRSQPPQSKFAEARPTTAPSGGIVDAEDNLGKRRTMSDSLTPPKASVELKSHRPLSPILHKSSEMASPPRNEGQQRPSTLQSAASFDREAADGVMTPFQARLHSDEPDASPSNRTNGSIDVEWSYMRHSSPLGPHISPPSVLSSSPGAIEISEATAVSIIPHNNRALLVVDQPAETLNPVNAVDEPQRTEVKFQGPVDIFVRPQIPLGQGTAVTPPSHETPFLNISSPTTPSHNNTLESIDSPLRNPRPPPEPPVFKIIPPTPNATTPVEEEDRQLGGKPSLIDSKSSVIRRFSSLKRSFSAKRHSDGLTSPFTFSRSLSLKDSRIGPRDDDPDARLHPLWRPRGFWDDYSDSDSDGYYDEEDIIVRNSLGMPQRRMIFDGPVSIVRRISLPRKFTRKRVVRKSSAGSLRRNGNGKMNANSGQGKSSHMSGLRDFQEKLQRLKAKRNEERKERTRDEIRKSIGGRRLEGDSRYI